jgi:hypothetical protein
VYERATVPVRTDRVAVVDAEVVVPAGAAVTDDAGLMGIAKVGGPSPGRFELFVDEVEMR